MQFGILGPLEVSRDGEPLRLGGTSQRALLALLLVHANETLSSERLIDELWPEQPPASGVAALQVRVSQLRKALGSAAQLLETRPSGYLLRVRRGELDLERFSTLLDDADGAEPAVAAEHLREALALWRGAPLADLSYEAFAQAPIRRMEELRLVALERRIEADLALGRNAALVGELRALVREEPLRERLHGALMLALYRSGRQAEALEIYRDARRTFIAELGLEPSPPLQQLEQAILRHDSQLTPAMPVRSILVVRRREDNFDVLLELAEPLARRPAKELILTQLVEEPDDLGTVSASLAERRSALLDQGVSSRVATFVSHAPAEDIVRIAVDQDVDLVLVDGSEELLQDPVLADLLARAPCDVAMLFGAGTRRGPVLVPFVGAEHDWTAVELGAWIAGALDVPLRLAGPRAGTNGRDASRLLASASLAVQLTLGVVAEPLLVEPGAAGLLTASEGAAFVVVGLSHRWRKRGLGDVRESLATAAKTPVVLVRRGLRPGGLAPREGLTRFTWSIKG